MLVVFFLHFKSGSRNLRGYNYIVPKYNILYIYIYIYIYIYNYYYTLLVL